MATFRLNTDKPTGQPTDGDYFLFEDASDSYNVKRAPTQSINTIGTDTITVGSAGNYTTIQLAFNFLENKMITGAVTVQLLENQTAGFAITEFIKNVILDLNGKNITVPSGGAITAETCKFQIANSSATTSNITTGTNGTGSAIYASAGTVIEILPSNPIVIGANGAGFNNGIYADLKSEIIANSSNVSVIYNNTNVLAGRDSTIIFNNATATNGTTDIQASTGSWIDATSATYSTVSPTINTLGNDRSYVKG